MKSDAANDQKNTGTGKMSGEAVITLPFDKTKELCYAIIVYWCMLSLLAGVFLAGVVHKFGPYLKELWK